jgi:hypothetical protein
MSDETWDPVWDSFKSHPTLQILTLHPIMTFGEKLLTPAVLTSRIQALVDILKVNTLIHTIDMDCRRYSVRELFRRSVIPSLKTNRPRSRLLAIQKTPQIAHRAKVLGRALLAVRTDHNRFWMLSAGNVEVAFPLTTATTTPVANLPTPVGASANAATGAANSVATGLPNVIDAISTSGQKCKACP